MVILMRIRMMLQGVLFVGILVIVGCSNMANQRTAEEWLSLSYSGLAAMDQYAFTGSTSMKLNNGNEFTPHTFEGKVVDHQQLTLQTSSEDPIQWNPVQVLEGLHKSHEKVSVTEKNAHLGTVTLLINEDSDITKKRWEQRLKHEIDELAMHAPTKESPYKEEWHKELERSREHLETMLKSMQAVSSYELVIDEKGLLPLKMEEKTIFSYKQNDHNISERRFTTVRFQSFDGAASNTIQ